MNLYEKMKDFKNKKNINQFHLKLEICDVPYGRLIFVYLHAFVSIQTKLLPQQLHTQKYPTSRPLPHCKQTLYSDFQLIQSTCRLKVDFMVSRTIFFRIQDASFFQKSGVHLVSDL